MVDTTETIFPPYNRKLVDMGDGTFAELIVAQPPAVLLTGSTNPRLRVDPGQTGFFEKREFRTFRRLAITAGTELIVKAVVPINIILFNLTLGIYQGLLDMETKVGGTEGGTFSETLPIFNRNNMSEPPPITVSQTILTAGGTHTGGTVLDVTLLKAADNSNFASSVGGTEGDERGIGVNTYYFRLQAITGQGDVLGVFKARWEERP